MPLLASILSQAGSADGSPSAQVIVPTLFLVAIVAVLIAALAFLRRAVFKREEADNDPLAGFSLGSLRQLVKDGKMTQEEFDKAKAQVVQAAQRKVDREAETPVETLAPEQKRRPEDLL